MVFLAKPNEMNRNWEFGNRVIYSYIQKISELEKHTSIIKKKKQKHDKIVLSAKSKLNRIVVLIFEGLIHLVISHDELVLINNVIKEFAEIKEIKNLKT